MLPETNQPNIIRPGFRFHLSTLILCALASGLMMLIAYYGIENARKMRELGNAVAADVVIWFIFIWPTIMGCVFAFNELRIRGTNARYAKEGESTETKQGG